MPIGKTILGWIMAVMLLLTACHDDDFEERAARVYLDLRAREDQHHAAVMHAEDPAVAQGDTAHYAADMRLLLDDMMEACSGMMDEGTMGGGQYNSARDAAGRMGGAIDAHASAMASLHVIEPMHDHCDKHHVDMTQMMDEMRVTMPDGAMGGGMM